MIRTATYDDIESVVDIYNQAIEAGFQTAFTERLTVAERVEWYRGHMSVAYPLFVYVIDNKVVGWFSISAYRPGRAALRHAVEISYFLDTRYLQRGIGSALMEHGLKACRDLHYKTAIAILLDKNVGSIKLLEKFGFAMWGFLPDIAEFDGVWCSHMYYGKDLSKQAQLKLDTC